jgi:molybdopterin-guanine dinucleotide biosynthesis protein A
MGTDKALLELEGRAFVERIAAAIRPIARSVTLVGRGGQVGDVAAIPDLRPGLGPLAGIESALAACATEQALVVACDLPFVTTALLELLLERSALQPDTAVVPLDADGRVSPLCAVYPRSSLPLVTELLDRGERTPRALLLRFPTDLLPFADYAHLAGATELLRNVNTPADLTEAERIATGLRVR